MTITAKEVAEEINKAWTEGFLAGYRQAKSDTENCLAAGLEHHKNH